MRLRLSLLLLFAFLSQPATSQKHAYQTLLGTDVTVGQGNGITQGPLGDDVAYVTVKDGRMFTIRESTGQVLNVYTPPEGGGGDCSSVVDWNEGGTQVFGTYAVDSLIIIVDVDGNRLHSFQVPFGDVVIHQPVAKNDMVYIASNAANTGFVSIYAPPRLFAQQTFQDQQIGPLAKGNANIYFGATTGYTLAMPLENPQALELEILQPAVDQATTGQPLLSTTDGTNNNMLVLVNERGTLYWWKDNGSITGGPDIIKQGLAPEGNGE